MFVCIQVCACAHKKLLTLPITRIYTVTVFPDGTNSVGTLVLSRQQIFQQTVGRQVRGSRIALNRDKSVDKNI